ncbi:MAG: DUF1493 family protein [Pleurocapsa minor HA4230-MV1]|jgi:acyl carrier protein|nr:DUF1493 family protein [Pleurocapsa minor HA4230-MV1]
MRSLEVEEQVKLFISQKTETKLEKISLQSELAKDFGVDGDDAVELMQNFSPHGVTNSSKR